MSYIPPGFSAVTAYLHLHKAPEFIEFVTEAFDAEVLMDHRMDGRIIHAELRIFGTIVELSEARPEWPAIGAAFHLYVPDARAVHARALAAGASELQPVTPQPYGEDAGALKDAWDIRWYIGTVTDMQSRTDGKAS